MDNKHVGGGSRGVSVGSASLVMIFTVVCLTVFAVLSLVTANSERKFSEKSAAAVSAYYSADCRCEETLSEIRGLAETAPGAEELFAAILRDAGLSERFEPSFTGGILYVNYAEAVDCTQDLCVTVSYDGERLTVLKWQVTENGAWSAGEDIEVWNGN